MEKAKNRVQEYLNRDEISEDQKQIHMDNLKPEINNLLIMYLPPHITIDQAEAIAVTIDHMIRFPEQYLNPNR